MSTFQAVILSWLSVDMAEPAGCPSKTLLNPSLQQAPQLQPHSFQALRDWNWFQASPTSSWGSNTTTSYAGPGYVQHHSPGRFPTVFVLGRGYLHCTWLMVIMPNQTPPSISQYRFAVDCWSNHYDFLRTTFLVLMVFCESNHMRCPFVL